MRRGGRTRRPRAAGGFTGSSRYKHRSVTNSAPCVRYPVLVKTQLEVIMRNVRCHRWLALAVALCCAAMLASSASAGAQPRTASHRADGQTQAPRHIFYIMMENHGYHEIIGNWRDAPFINGLA